MRGNSASILLAAALSADSAQPIGLSKASAQLALRQGQFPQPALAFPRNRAK